MSNTDLYLHEAILLLALRDEKGTIDASVHYPYAIAGAILAEFVLTNRVSIDASKRSKKVNPIDSTPFGDLILDECLEKIRTKKKPDSAQNWVSRFSQIKGLKHRVAQQLVQRGILRMDEDKILLMFKRKIYPEVNPEPERRIIAQMHEAIFSDSENIEPRILVMIALAKAADILKVVFDKKELKTRKKRLKQIEKGELVGIATKEAIEAMQAALAASAAISASIAATAAATS